MTISRRTMMQTGLGFVAGASILPMMPTRLRAKSQVLLGSEVQVDVLSDGHLVLPTEFILPDISKAEREAFLTAHGMPTERFEPDCNITLVRSGSEVILFDVGAGANFMPTAGKLPGALEELGVDPEEVTQVIFTHAHPDHLWGLEDDFGDLLFPEASYHMAAAEMDYWTDGDTLASIGPERQAFVAGAQRQISAIAPQIKRFRAGTEIVPGVFAHGSEGHTPGHCSFEIRGGQESLMVIGDALTNAAVSFEKPEWPSGSDQDKALGITTRKRLLDQLASDKMMMIGFHMPFPGLGRAERKDQAYRFVPA